MYQNIRKIAIEYAFCHNALEYFFSMQTTQKTLPKSQILLTVELEDAEWKKYRDQAVRKLGEKAEFSGFRKGHVPEKVLLEKLGEHAILAEAMDLALPQTYMDAVKTEDIHPIAHPDIKLLSESPFRYEATISIMPEVELKPLKMKLQKEKFTVTEKEIEQMIVQFQNQLAEKKEVDRAIRKGDTALVDFEGFDTDGVSLEGTQSKNHPVEIGSKMMIPGFEEELIGLKKGETKSFEVTFPKDYQAARMAGKKVRFEIAVHAVEEKVLPKVDEDFVKNLTGKKKPVSGLKKEIKEALLEKKQNEQRKEHENQLLDAVFISTIVDMPEILIDEEVNYLLDNIKMQGLQQGITWENHLMHLKKSEEDLKKELRSQAEKQSTTRLGIQKFIAEEGKKISDTDIQKEVNLLLQRTPEEKQAEQKQKLQKGAEGWKNIENKIKVQKWMDEKISEHES